MPGRPAGPRLPPLLPTLLQGLGDGQTLLIAEGAASKDPGALARLILDAPFGPHSVTAVVVPALLNGILLESPEASCRRGTRVAWQPSPAGLFGQRASPAPWQACRLLMAAAPPLPTAPAQTLTALGSKLSVLGCGGDALSAGLVGRFLEACGHNLCVLVGARLQLGAAAGRTGAASVIPCTPAAPAPQPAPACHLWLHPARPPRTPFSGHRTCSALLKPQSWSPRMLWVLGPERRRRPRLTTSPCCRSASRCPAPAFACWCWMAPCSRCPLVVWASCLLQAPCWPAATGAGAAAWAPRWGQLPLRGPPAALTHTCPLLTGILWMGRPSWRCLSTCGAAGPPRGTPPSVSTARATWSAGCPTARCRSGARGGGQAARCMHAAAAAA